MTFLRSFPCLSPHWRHHSPFQTEAAGSSAQSVSGRLWQLFNDFRTIKPEEAEVEQASAELCVFSGRIFLSLLSDSKHLYQILPNGLHLQDFVMDLNRGMHMTQISRGLGDFATSFADLVFACLVLKACMRACSNPSSLQEKPGWFSPWKMEDACSVFFSPVWVFLLAFDLCPLSGVVAGSSQASYLNWLVVLAVLVLCKLTLPALYIRLQHFGREVSHVPRSIQTSTARFWRIWKLSRIWAGNARSSKIPARYTHPTEWFEQIQYGCIQNAACFPLECCICEAILHCQDWPGQWLHYWVSTHSGFESVSWMSWFECLNFEEIVQQMVQQTQCTCKVQVGLPPDPPNSSGFRSFPA